MAEHSEENIFSKAIGALRDEKENLLQQKATKKAEVEAIKIANAARKKAQEQREWEHWLEKSEELFVKDCFETIGNISVEDFAAKHSGTIPFYSEAFMWFAETLHPIPLLRPMKVEDLTISELRDLAPAGSNWKLNYKPGQVHRRAVEEEIQDKLDKEGRMTWASMDILNIFNGIKKQLRQERFYLTTEDGLKFVLQWSSK